MLRETVERVEPMSDTEQIPALPGLKCLGRLSEIRPVIIVDSREQDPLPFFRLKTIRDGLLTGDYSFVGGTTKFAVERKSVSDLVSCCTNSSRERFENELHRLRGFEFRRLLIVGSRDAIAQENYHSKLPARVVFNTLSAFEVRYSIPVVFLPTPEEAAIQIESWTYWFSRELVESANTLARDNGLTEPTRRAEPSPVACPA